MSLALRRGVTGDRCGGDSKERQRVSHSNYRGGMAHALHLLMAYDKPAPTRHDEARYHNILPLRITKET